MDVARAVLIGPVEGINGGYCVGSHRFRFRPSPSLFSAVAIVLLHSIVPAAHAQVVVPSVLATTEGNSRSLTVINESARTYQTQIAASELAALVGQVIGGISFRMDNSLPFSSVSMTFASYQVMLSGAARPIASFSPTFAANIGANALSVYDAALTFPNSGFVDGAGGTTPNPFGMIITFSSPYRYSGGDLVITIRHSGYGINGPLTFGPLADATTSTAQGYGSLFVGQFSQAGQSAATAQFTGSATVLQLNSLASGSATGPEPAVGFLILVALPFVGTIARRTVRLTA